MLSVTLAFSEFWLMLAVICSMEAVVSSTEAACSEDDWLSDCAVAETWAAALFSASAATLIWPMVSASLAMVLLMACLSASKSPL